MILNPKYLIQNEIITFPKSINIDKFIQQNGTDIDCIELFLLSGTLRISEEKKESVDRMLMQPELNNTWVLRKGNAYEFNSSFKIEVPATMGGSVIGRSTFNRAGILIRSSWFDSGFTGTLGGTIYCFNDCILTKGTRVGQFIMHSAESASLYSGQYQSVKSIKD